MSDFFGVVSAITGKIELVYEGEQEGAESVAKQLITNAVKTLFPKYFPNIEKLEKDEDESPYDGIINWFFENEGFEILDHISNEDYNTLLNSVRPLNDLIENYQPELPDFEITFMKEFLLWGLVQSNKLTQKRFNKGIQIQDPFGSFIRKL
jgi:magnesium chelatase subunit I